MLYKHIAVSREEFEHLWSKSADLSSFSYRWRTKVPKSNPICQLYFWIWKKKRPIKSMSLSISTTLEGGQGQSQGPYSDVSRQPLEIEIKARQRISFSNLNDSTRILSRSQTSLIRVEGINFCEGLHNLFGISSRCQTCSNGVYHRLNMKPSLQVLRS